MRQSMTSVLEQGHGLGRVMYLCLLAGAYHAMGEGDEGLRLLTEAQAQMEKSGERFYEAELHRLKGELLLQQSPGNTTEAESCFQQAISIAQNQSAKSWELRAATCLARLWQRQNKHQEAHDLLAPVYNWFTEGFDTADLIEAKALLDELSEVRS
jgi:predicted ATPase